MTSGSWWQLIQVDLGALFSQPYLGTVNLYSYVLYGTFGGTQVGSVLASNLESIAAVMAFDAKNYGKNAFRIWNI